MHNSQRFFLPGLLLSLLLGSGWAAAQVDPTLPGGRINRNPVFRDSLPPEPGVTQDARDTVLPSAGTADPRDSTTRPVTSPSANTDGRSVLLPGTAAQTPVPAPAPAPAASAPAGSRP